MLKKKRKVISILFAALTLHFAPVRISFSQVALKASPLQPSKLIRHPGKRHLAHVAGHVVTSATGHGASRFSASTHPTEFHAEPNKATYHFIHQNGIEEDNPERCKIIDKTLHPWKPCHRNLILNHKHDQRFCKRKTYTRYSRRFVTCGYFRGIVGALFWQKYFRPILSWTRSLGSFFLTCFFRFGHFVRCSGRPQLHGLGLWQKNCPQFQKKTCKLSKPLNRSLVYLASKNWCLNPFH